MEEGIHNVVCAVLTSDPWANRSRQIRPKMLLLQRNEDDKYWPGKWSIMSEHINPGETPLSALARGMYEELDMFYPRDYLFVRGPLRVQKIDPDHQERFDVQIYQCVIMPMERREICVDREENQGYRWACGDVSDNYMLLGGPSHFLCNLADDLDNLFSTVLFQVNGIEISKLLQSVYCGVPLKD